MLRGGTAKAGAIFAIAATGMLGVGTPAAGAAQVDIVSPADSARVKDGAFEARVEVRGPRFRALLNGRDVTRSFSDGPVRSARFALGGALKPGDANLQVSAGRGATPASDQHHFSVLRRDDSTLAIKEKEEKLVRPAPMLRLRSDVPIVASRIRVNGVAADDDFGLDPDLRGLRGRFGAHRGVRPGRNRATFEVEQRNGVIARASASFTVPKDSPIASAGEDETVGVGETATLDGRDTIRPRTERGAGPPAYEWSVLQAPPGSEAAIQQADTLTPAFVPDVPGTYQVLVKVTQGGVTSADEVEVNAPPEDDPTGLPIQTITDDGAIQIGEPGTPGVTTFPRQGDFVQMLVLDPTNGTPEPGTAWDQHSGIDTGKGGVLAFDQGQGAQLLAAVEAVPSSYLVVLSGQGNAGVGPVDISADASDLEQAIEHIGGTVDRQGMTPNGAADLGSGAWSVIGRGAGDGPTAGASDQLAKGGASQNQFIAASGVPGFMGGDGGQPGSLNGYLQKVTTLGYQFVSADVVPIDTKWTPDPTQPPSPTQNTILVGDEKHQTGVVQEGDLWIHLLVLDQGTLEPVHNEAYRAIAASRETDFSGIAQLSEALHRYAADRSTGASHLVIMQDFGTHPEPDFPAGNSADWVDDVIPNFNASPKWHGDSFPGGAAVERNWNAKHPNGTVAGNVGLLAGSVGHDVVANYRRPYFDQASRKVIPRNTGGLTVIASSNLYQQSSAFVQGQTPPEFTGSSEIAPLLGNGRIVGSLRRNNQSQYAIGATSFGPGAVGLDGSGQPISEPYGNADFAQVALRPATPWPCTPEAPAPCPLPDNPSGADELEAALAYVSQTGTRFQQTDIREEYAEDTFVPEAASRPIEALTYAEIPNPEFDEEVFDAMKQQILAELDDLEEVNGAFTEYQKLLAPDNADFDIAKASSQVTTALNKLKRDLPQQQALFDTGTIVSESIFAASGVAMVAAAADPATFVFAPGALTALGYVVEMGFKLDDFFDPKTAVPPRSQVDDDIDLVKTETDDVTGIVKGELESANDTMKHFWDLIRTDPVKLDMAATNFFGKWQLGTEEERRLGQAYAIGAQRQLWYSIAPIVFDQWALGPGQTDINNGGPQDLPDVGYNCRQLFELENGEVDISSEFNPPLGNVPPSMSTATSVPWSGNPPKGPPHGDAVGYLVRFLKFSASPNDPETRLSDASEFQKLDTFLQKKGVSPSGTLMDPLFEQTSSIANYRTPTQLGMSKDVFFGQPYWKLRKLQCGRRP